MGPEPFKLGSGGLTGPWEGCGPWRPGSELGRLVRPSPPPSATLFTACEAELEPSVTGDSLAEGGDGLPPMELGLLSCRVSPRGGPGLKSLEQDCWEYYEAYGVFRSDIRGGFTLIHHRGHQVDRPRRRPGHVAGSWREKVC